MKLIFSLVLILQSAVIPQSFAYEYQTDDDTEAQVECEDCGPRRPPSHLQRLPVEERAQTASTQTTSHDWGQLLGGGMNLLGAFLNYRSKQKTLNFYEQYGYFQSPYQFGNFGYGYGSGYGYGYNNSYGGYGGFSGWNPFSNTYGTRLGNGYGYGSNFGYGGYGYGGYRYGSQAPSYIQLGANTTNTYAPYLLPASP